MRAAPARRALTGLLAVLILVAAATATGAEGAPVPPKLEVLDKAGNPETRAGVAPDRFLTRLVPASEEDIRGFEIDFPAGMGGDPSATPVCPRALFESSFSSLCTEDTRVGTLKNVKASHDEEFPIYNVAPAPGQIASYGIVNTSFPIKFDGHLRSSDFGLTMRSNSFPQIVSGGPTLESVFEFWGVPADHQVGTATPRRAVLVNPTRCDHGPISITVHARTWQHPEQSSATTVDTGMPLVGCDALPFSASIDFGLDTPVVDSPTGFDLDASFPESSGPDVPIPSQVKTIEFAFPFGMGISPGAAGGLTACTDAQLARGSDTPASCPRSSRVGAVEMGIPQLATPLKGDVYIGSERPGERFRLFVVATDAGTETEAKFISTMRVDPVSGRLISTMSNLPEASFRHLRLHFDGGPKALFVAPSNCGPATTSATIVPYSGTAPLQVSDSVDIGPRAGRRCGAPAPFDPSVTTALSARHGGQPTSFSALIERRDDEQAISRFSLSFPPGLGANLASVTPCPDASLSAGGCTAASRIGSAVVSVGTGPETAELTGNAYLAGRSGKSPFGVAMVFHLALGPFDLGTLAVRSKLEVDPLTGQVAVDSGTLPQTVEGLPIRFRSIGLDMDRPGFLRAPTSCRPLPVAATLMATEGAVAHPTSQLSVSHCIDLPFEPFFGMALTGRDELHKGGSPGLRLSMRAKSGEANLHSMTISLPPALQLNPQALNEICARRSAMKRTCPKGSRVGSGTVQTPILSKPMKGSTYLVQPKGGGEPDLWTIFKGEGIELVLRSVSAVKKGQLKTSFEGLPDTAMSRFTMELAANQALTMRHGICSKKGGAPKLHAPATLEGQNGAYRQRQVAVGTPAKSC